MCQTEDRILKKEDATRYRSACMRLSYLAKDGLDLAETGKHLAQRMSDLREFDFIPCGFEDKNRLTKSQSSWTAISLATQFREKSTTGLVAQIWNHTVKSGSTPQGLTALIVGETDFYAALTGGQVRLSLRSIYVNLGLPMKVAIQSDSSTSNSLTDRLE